MSQSIVEAQQFFRELGWTWDLERCEFIHSDKIVSYTVRASRSGSGWVAKREELELPQVTKREVFITTFMGPEMPDPVAAYVHAKVEDWGRA